MSQADSLHGRYRSLVADLTGALEANDDAAFRGAFELLRNALNVDLNPELRRLTASAQGALQRFRDNTRVDALASQAMPSARKRLEHVVKLTDDAAHGTLDLVERCLPLVQQNARDAARLLAQLEEIRAQKPESMPAWIEASRQFLERVVVGADRKRELLSQMLVAQGYQDLTGQILRGVIGLVGELEAVLGGLVALSNGEDTRRMPVLRMPDDAESLRRGTGPQVPGLHDADAVDGQQDVDALLARMGGL
jgi:chemotaxis protein CheZ